MTERCPKCVWIAAPVHHSQQAVEKVVAIEEEIKQENYCTGTNLFFVFFIIATLHALLVLRREKMRQQRKTAVTSLLNLKT